MPRKTLKIREESPPVLPTETAQARRFGKARLGPVERAA